MTQICISKFTIIGSDNGLLPIRHQAIIWNNAGILLIRTLGTNFSEILIQIHTFSNKNMHLKMLSGKCWPFCLRLNVLKIRQSRNHPIFNMGIAIPGKDDLYIETGPCWLVNLPTRRQMTTLHLPDNRIDPPLTNLSTCTIMCYSQQARQEHCIVIIKGVLGNWSE